MGWAILTLPFLMIFFSIEIFIVCMHNYFFKFRNIFFTVIFIFQMHYKASSVFPSVCSARDSHHEGVIHGKTCDIYIHIFLSPPSFWTGRRPLCDPLKKFSHSSTLMREFPKTNFPHIFAAKRPRAG